MDINNIPIFSIQEVKELYDELKPIADQYNTITILILLAIYCYENWEKIKSEVTELKSKDYTRYPTHEHYGLIEYMILSILNTNYKKSNYKEKCVNVVKKLGYSFYSEDKMENFWDNHFKKDSATKKKMKRRYNDFFEQKKNEMENYYYYLLHHPNADFSVSDSSTIYWHEEGSSRNILSGAYQSCRTSYSSGYDNTGNIISDKKETSLDNPSSSIRGNSHFTEKEEERTGSITLLSFNDSVFVSVDEEEVNKSQLSQKRNYTIITHGMNNTSENTKKLEEGNHLTSPSTPLLSPSPHELSTTNPATPTTDTFSTASPLCYRWMGYNKRNSQSMVSIWYAEKKLTASPLKDTISGNEEWNSTNTFSENNSYLNTTQDTSQVHTDGETDLINNNTDSSLVETKSSNKKETVDSVDTTDFYELEFPGEADNVSDQ